MRRNHLWILGALLLASVQLTACRHSSNGTAEAAAEEAGPAKVVHGEGEQPTRVTLTQDAAHRLDIKTDVIREADIDGQQQMVIPYDAVLYDPEGDTWTYTNPEPLVFVRYHIRVDRIVGNQAVLAVGPPRGTAVVTVGATELFGSESEFEEE